MKMPKLVYYIHFIFAFVFVTTWVSAQQHSTGFNREVLFDESRNYGESHRPIVINYWYPAENRSTQKKFTFRDYILAGSQKADLSKLTTKDEEVLIDVFRANLSYFNITESQFSKVLLQPAASGLATKPLPAKYPLVVLVGGTGGSNGFFTTWAEQLSAKGLVVVTLSSFGENDTTACGYDLSCIQNQTKDIAYTVKAMSKKSFVNESKISMVVWSFGGLSAMLYQSEHKKVNAILSIDSAFAE
jgi:predicted dienelactone hydrolase